MVFFWYLESGMPILSLDLLHPVFAKKLGRGFCSICPCEKSREHSGWEHKSGYVTWGGLFNLSEPPCPRLQQEGDSKLPHNMQTRYGRPLEEHLAQRKYLTLTSIVLSQWSLLICLNLGVGDWMEDIKVGNMSRLKQKCYHPLQMFIGMSICH